MADIIAGISHPELIVGIAGPIGIDIDAITDAISDSFDAVGYTSIQIRITNEIDGIPSKVPVPKKADYYSVIRYKMAHATEICRKNVDQAYLMRIAIDAIQRERGKVVAALSKHQKSRRARSSGPIISPVPQRVVYVIRQIKRPEEVLLLREVYRDIKIGVDPNDIIKREVVRDLLEKLVEAKLLAKTATGNAIDLVKRLLEPKSPSNRGAGAGCLRGAMAMDLTEFGRVVHAEMSAICDAARCGVSLKGATLFCTTFPCHNCTKHIIAAGIRRVIYMEPYPKSKAKELHQHEIEIEEDTGTKVSFIPFLGIAPHRYRDIFRKKSARIVALQSLGTSENHGRWWMLSRRPISSSRTLR